MIPVFESGPTGHKGYSFDDLAKRLATICKEHQTERRARAFAFLLHDASTPEFGKMLGDNDYWRALDQISGSFLSVFTLVSPQPGASHEREWHSMVAVSSPEDTGTRTQLVLRSYFGIEKVVTFPALMLFQLDGRAVVGYALVQLKATTIEGAFTELRELLRDLADAIGRAPSALSHGPEAAWNAISGRLRKRKAIRAVNAGHKVLQGINELADLAGLVGIR